MRVSVPCMQILQEMTIGPSFIHSFRALLKVNQLSTVQPLQSLHHTALYLGTNTLTHVNRHGQAVVFQRHLLTHSLARTLSN
mmetsp:Transcript_21814/g.62074  ORF Transcript_21814/g.62074 Transcript_21814/m.62074 type:complete len:82 (-) Transcript_21814:1429-1674(-)